MDFSIIYVTIKNRDQAAEIARRLLEERLVACSNIIDGVTSLYWWEGKICEEKEVVMISKTRSDLVDRAIDRIKIMHEYDCPCIISVEIDKGDPHFFEWINTETMV